jgi:O-methyltransferase involved in polyketide biosynthesis
VSQRQYAECPGPCGVDAAGGALVDDFDMDDDAPPRGFDPSKPSIARVYDAFLGGKDNSPADREVTARLAEISPEFVPGARDNRAFIGRAVTWAAARGIRQFLDLGSGLPTHPAVHEFAREAIPDARVCYVDNDPVAVLRAQALLADPAGIAVIKADLTGPDAVLAEAAAGGIDLTEPVCVIFAMVLHFYPPDQARSIVAAYMSRVPAGSTVVISTGRMDDPDAWHRMRDGYSASATYNHSRDEVASFFAGLEIVPPGLVRAVDWRNVAPESGAPSHGRVYPLGGVAVAGPSGPSGQ